MCVCRIIFVGSHHLCLTLVVLFNGGVLAIEEFLPRVDAVLEAWYGQERWWNASFAAAHVILVFIVSRPFTFIIAITFARTGTLARRAQQQWRLFCSVTTIQAANCP